MNRSRNMGLLVYCPRRYLDDEQIVIGEQVLERVRVDDRWCCRQRVCERRVMARG